MDKKVKKDCPLCNFRSVYYYRNDIWQICDCPICGKLILMSIEHIRFGDIEDKDIQYIITEAMKIFGRIKFSEGHEDIDHFHWHITVEDGSAPELYKLDERYKNK